MQTDTTHYQETSERMLIIEVAGSPRERGRQQGEGARAQVRSMLGFYKEVLPLAAGLEWSDGLREARKYLPYGEEAFPDFVEELRGVAEGAGVPFLEAWTVNCYEALVHTEQSWGCTCVAVRDDLTAGGHVLIGHNEDWHSRDRDHVYLVQSRPDDGVPFIGLTYGPLLVNVGMNAAGIGVAINSVFPADVRVGVPRVLCSRSILAAQTIGQAIRACMPPLRAGGYNYLLADQNGEVYNVETAAAAHDILYGEEGWAAHANHYLSSKMRKLETPGRYAGSHVRFNRARRLLKAQLGSVSVESLQGLLRDHVNYPDAICSHEDPAEPPHERGQTVASLVMDLTDRTMWAALGPPCEHVFVPYRL